jgi:hypothetical protein
MTERLVMELFRTLRLILLSGAVVAGAARLAEHGALQVRAQAVAEVEKAAALIQAFKDAGVEVHAEVR